MYVFMYMYFISKNGIIQTEKPIMSRYCMCHKPQVLHTSSFKYAY